MDSPASTPPGDSQGRIAGFSFQTRVTGVDVHSGTLICQSLSGGETTPQFDLIEGGDDAGSVVRHALQEQVPGFTVETRSLPNYCTMIELDRVGGRLDRNYLHGLSTSPYHIGQKLTCSRLRGGKAVLIGDAAAPFPPIGQGVNAALESSMVLDLCVGETGASPGGLLEAAGLYDARWKPEADAVSWISERSLFENPYHEIRALFASMLGISIFDRAKSVELPYSDVKRRAEALWPLWA